MSTENTVLTFIRTLKEKKEYTFGRSQNFFMIERLLEKGGIAITDLLMANSESIKIELAKLGNTKKDIQILYNNINELNIDKPEQKNGSKKIWAARKFFPSGHHRLADSQEKSALLAQGFCKSRIK